MSTHWWRAYDEAVDDPKLILLSDRAHRAWFNLMCLTSANNGALPPIEIIAIKLRMPEKKIEPILDELVQRGLLDDFDGVLRPHNWNGRQFKSDVSTERVQQFRERQRNVSVTPPETEADTETDSERKKTDFRAVAKATRPVADLDFERFWRAYPKRDGANPKAPARKSFLAFVKAGIDPGMIAAGAQRCAIKETAKIGTPYIPQAVKWLRDRRWEDYPEVEEATEKIVTGWQPGMRTSEEILADLRAKNERSNPEAGGGVRPESPRVHGEPIENPRQEFEGRDIPDDQTRKPGMASVGTILHRIPGLRTCGDEARSVGRDEIDDGSDPMAGVVR